MEKFRGLVREIIFNIAYALDVKLRRIYARQKAEHRLARFAPPMVRMVELNGLRFGVWLEYGGVIEDRIISWGDWSRALLQYSEHLLPVAPVIIEIGANIGFESLYYAKRFPAGRVVAFEPGSYGYQTLLKSRSYNRLENLTVHRLGVGDVEGQLELRTPSATSGNKGLGSFQSNPDIDHTYQCEFVNVVTLDGFFDELDHIDLIKIDTQGYEWPILQGGLGIISRHRPTIIFEFEDHYHSNALASRALIAKYFSDLQYSLFIPQEDCLVPIDLAQAERVHCDLFALPNPVQIEHVQDRAPSTKGGEMCVIAQ